MSTVHLCRAVILSCVMTVAAVASAAADPAEGSDHPLVGRYAGATQTGQQDAGFDEVSLIAGPISGARRDANSPGWITVEGKASFYYYALPAGRSSLEVLRNYEASLTSRGFAIDFTCATGNGSCYVAPAEGRVVETHSAGFAVALDAGPEWPRLGGDYVRNYFGENARYMLARLQRESGAVYASIVITEHGRGNHAFVRVVETGEPMDMEMIRFIGADEMRSTLDDAGHISLYGIWFDTGDDAMKAESQRTVAEIAKLLNADTGLRVEVVGHTDGQGAAELNAGLSERRARNVVAALVGEHGIDTKRLQARGAGASQPVASNDDEEGRTRNRRVELVKL